MIVSVRRFLLVLVLGAASLTACGGGDPDSSPGPEARRSDPVGTATEAVADHDATTATAAPEPPEDESAAEDEVAATTEAQPTAQTDWENTTYRMRAYSGSDLEDLSFTDGVAETTVIVDVKVDPTNPHRVAMVSTSSDSEGFPLFVNAGIFTLDHGSGVAVAEAEVSSMTGFALQVHVCTTGTTWDGGDELSLEFGSFNVGEAGSLLWTRDGETLQLHEGEEAASNGSGDAAGSGNALDVSSYDEVHFTSPSGSIDCTMNGANGGWAACYFPPEMDTSQVPDDHCEHTSLLAVGAGAETGWICTGGAFVFPEVSTSYTSWFEDTGWEPAVSELGGQERATAAVPYGTTLALDAVRCRSAEDGMHCSRTDSGAGFSVSRAGVQFTGPRTDTFTELWD